MQKTPEALIKEKILILDGAMGSMIQNEHLTEEDYKGSLFRDHPKLLKGNNDLLCLTRPQLIEDIHFQYLMAGADIIETNTFNATRISQSEYGLEGEVVSINRAAVKAAQAARTRYAKETSSSRPIFIAGALGPTSKTASLASDVKNPMLRNVTFQQLFECYREQIVAFAEAGADLILVETSFDTLNLKAAIFAYKDYFSSKDKKLPLMLSLTITDLSGRTLSGQTIEAAWWSIRHADAFSVGINCALGAKEIRPYIESLARLADIPVSCYPNAGLPNPLSPTGYDQAPDDMASVLRTFAADGLVNIVGGCCGTTPAHIAAIKAAVDEFPPRKPPEYLGGLTLSGLEPFWYQGEKAQFIMVGERTNVTGSPRFAEAMRRNSYEDALKIALQQVENGANVLDINFDDGLIDSKASMVNFLHLIGSEPSISRVPIMLDSSKWEVLEAGLRCIQGKGIVNSISLKDGEEEFLRRAELVKRYGAAVIVMAFDEQGQAATKEDKVRIAQRAYKLLTEKINFNPFDIIFDPNVLTVGTGMAEHSRYGLDFIEATKEIKVACPGALVSGGISNLSFSFRGVNKVREAMHSIFLFHAIRAGLDMGIVNAGMLEVYDDIEPELKELAEDVILCRGGDATEALIKLASSLGTEEVKTQKVKQNDWRQLPLKERVTYALVHGVTEFIEDDTLSLYKEIGQALQVIEGPLMEGMGVVGDLFGKGKMFLPQVVKSARVMKLAVEKLLPFMMQDKTTAKTRGTFVIATVKGDVHDIGKNIVSVVLSCNHFRVIDLGVMVPAEKILEVAREEKADFIGLSGLITPSLDEMIYFAKNLEREGITVPLLIGGATTSKMHTAVKIAPHYQGGVIHVGDASQVAQVLSSLLSEGEDHSYRKKISQDQENLRKQHQARVSEVKLIPLGEAREHRAKLTYHDDYASDQEIAGVRYFEHIPLNEVLPFVDWAPFFWVWGLSGFYPKILSHPLWGTEAQKLFDDAQQMLAQWEEKKLCDLSGAIGIWPAASSGDDVWVNLSAPGKQEKLKKIHFLRQQRINESGSALCLSDFVAPQGSGTRDFMGAFACKAGGEILSLPDTYVQKHDDYSAILVKSLADRLAEAMSEYLHKKVRDIMGYGKNEQFTIENLVKEEYRGIRPAPGYPACPDHTEKAAIWELLSAEEKLGISLTESYAMNPGSAVSGFYFFHPEARYFRLGKVTQEQVLDYAQRKGWSQAEAERWLAPQLADK